MFYWDIEQRNHKKADQEQLEELIQKSEKHFIAYNVGKIVLHEGQFLHQIAPAKDMLPEDERITLQGHALKYDGVWRVYW